MHVGVVAFREMDFFCGTIVIGLKVCLKRIESGEMLDLLVEQEKNDHTWTLYRLAHRFCPTTLSTSSSPCYIL